MKTKTEEGERKLAQLGDQMFERNLAILAAKGREICVSTTIDDEYTGFASGLDDEYLQLCLTDDQSHVLVNRSYVVRLEETGRTLDDVEETVDGARRIRERVRMFMMISGYHIENR